MKLAGRKDIAVVVAALIICGAAALLPRVSGGSRVRIYVGGELYREAPLDKPRTIVVSQPGGRRNVIRIEDGGVYMLESTCENQLCVRQGTITPDNTASRPMSNWIICLPNRVSVELVGEGRHEYP